MFQHPLLKNRKTRKAPSFRLVDDVTPVEEPVNALEASLAQNVVASAIETESIPEANDPLENHQPEEVPNERIVSLGAPEVSPQSQF